MEEGHTAVPAGNIRLQRPMMHHEALSFKKLQSSAYEFDSYTLPLFSQLETVSPDATKLAQLECIPIIGNLSVVCIISRFIIHANEFDCLNTSTRLKLVGVALFVFVFGFIPFLNVWLVYKLKPLYLCWRLFSNDIGSKGLYQGNSEGGRSTDSIIPPDKLAKMSLLAGRVPSNLSVATSTSTLNGTPPLSSSKYHGGPGDKHRTMDSAMPPPVRYPPGRRRPERDTYASRSPSHSPERGGYARRGSESHSFDSRGSGRYSFDSREPSRAGPPRDASPRGRAPRGRSPRGRAPGRGPPGRGSPSRGPPEYSPGRSPSRGFPPEKTGHGNPFDSGSDNEQNSTRRGYSSFLPMPSSRNTIADSEYDAQSTAGRSFESARVSQFPEEADFLKSKYSVRQSAIDNWPLK
ncbi:hypothetical protein GGF46_003204 [Coemansia sp. RSA 552]|nr:hypothetical protein GGF46_003204 [Coemansia sp. RSA 552]